MNSTYKLICTDIDGTLLNSDRWLSDETVSAFAKANLPTILASSRMPNALTYIQEGLNITGSPLIAYNGSLIIGRDSKVLDSIHFSTEVLKALLPHHKQYSYNLSIYSHNHWFTDKEDTWSLREINNTRVTPVYQSASESLSFLNEANLGIHKLMCMGDSSEIDSIVQHLSPIFEEEVHLYRSKDTYLEITPRNIDKAKALKTLLNSEFNFGMEAVMAFGDNHNDDELIKHSKLGVAVGNATTTLKALADYISPYTNKENAVAKVIEKFI